MKSQMICINFLFKICKPALKGCNTSRNSKTRTPSATMTIYTGAQAGLSFQVGYLLSLPVQQTNICKESLPILIQDVQGVSQYFIFAFLSKYVLRDC